MYQIKHVSHFLVLISLLFGYTAADCVSNDTIGTNMASWSNETACGAPNPPPDDSDGITIIATPLSKKKRAIWDNSSWIPEGYRYQVSPYFKPAAVLRACSGSVVTSFDTEHANLNGRGQTFVSQRNMSKPCCSNHEPIRLFSGLGASVTIIKEDIFFPGGVLHIADGFFTIPTLLSQSLNSVASTGSSLLSNGLKTFDYTPSITVFMPSNSACLAKLSCGGTLSAGDAKTVLNAQVVKNFVAYSPNLVDGAFFQAANGEDITITVKKDGSKYANGKLIVQQDIVIENGVVHVVDGLFNTPTAPCTAGTPKTVTLVSTITQTSTVYPPPETSTVIQVPPLVVSTLTVTPHSIVSTLTSPPPPVTSTSSCTTPPSISTSIYTPPPVISSSIYTPPPVLSTSTFNPPPRISTSTYTPPPVKTSSIYTPPPSTSTSIYTPPPRISFSTTTPKPHTTETPTLSTPYSAHVPPSSEDCDESGIPYSKYPGGTKPGYSPTTIPTSVASVPTGSYIMYGLQGPSPVATTIPSQWGSQSQPGNNKYRTSTIVHWKG